MSGSPQTEFEKANKRGNFKQTSQVTENGKKGRFGR